MTEELTSPLKDIISRMAKTPVKGEASRIKERFCDTSGAVIALCDVSGSMTDLVGHSQMSKHEHLKIALEDVVAGFPKLILVAFASRAKRFTPASSIPDPSRGALGGGTDLAHALDSIRHLKPAKTIVISDGLPDDQAAALVSASLITGAIDTIYCGPDAHPACAFLQRLSRSTGGASATWNGYKPIASVIRGLLAAPESS